MVADVGTESEDVREAAVAKPLAMLVGSHGLGRVERGVRVMPFRECPSVIAVEIVLDAAGEVCRGEIEGAGMQHVPHPQSRRRCGDLGGKTTACMRAAQDLLAVNRAAMPPYHIARGDNKLARLAETRTDALDSDTEALHRFGDIGRCAGPRAPVARIAEHTSDSHAIEPSCPTARQTDGERRSGHRSGGDHAVYVGGYAHWPVR